MSVQYSTVHCTVEPQLSEQFGTVVLYMHELIRSDIIIVSQHLARFCSKIRRKIF